MRYLEQERRKRDELNLPELSLNTVNNLSTVNNRSTANNLNTDNSKADTTPLLLQYVYLLSLCAI